MRETVRPLAAAALAILALGCAPAATPDRALLENELTIRTLLSTWESADTEVMLDLFWPDATYDDFPNQTTYRGLEEITGYLTGVHEWGDDVYMNVGSVHAGPTGAVAEWAFSAVQNRAVGSMMPTATGREVFLNGVTIVEIDGGRIRRAADYSDVVPMMLQLGAVIRLPGGDTISLDSGGN